MTTSDRSGRCSGDIDPLCFREIPSGIARVNAEGVAHGYSPGDGVALGQRSQGQEHWTGCSARSFVPAPEVVTSPLGTSVDPSVKGDALFQRHYSSLALGIRGLRAAVWTRGQTF